MKRNRYNFKLNQPPPSDEQIARHQDFDALLGQLESGKKNGGGLVRTLYWLAPLAAAAVAGWMLFGHLLMTAESDPYFEEAQAYFDSKPFVNPPLPNLEAKFVSKKFNAFEGGSFVYENGSRVVIPKAAFINEAGEVIGGEVEIKFKEYHDYVDFFLSGIPMHYDSLDTRYQLESAGMMELYAEQDGKRLNVAPGKEIQVELQGEVWVPTQSPNQLPKFNIYHLNVDRKNWKYEGVDKLSWADELPDLNNLKATAQKSYSKELTQIEKERSAALLNAEKGAGKPVAPREPKLTKEDDVTFDLAFNEFDDPSLAGLKEQYEGTLWKVVDNEQAFNQNVAAGVQWEDMDLKKLNELDFELTLYSGGNSIKVIVNPVLTGSDLVEAQNLYKSAFAKYQAELAAWESGQSERMASVQRKYDALALAAKNEFEDVLSTADQNSQGVLKRKVVNRFTADRLGIWNCDFPMKPFNTKVKGKFVDDAEKLLDQNTGYLVDKKRNTLSRFYTTNETPVSYNDQSASLMWIVAEDGQIAIFEPKNFEQIKKNESTQTFKMRRINKDIKSEAELRSLLDF